MLESMSCGWSAAIQPIVHNEGGGTVSYLIIPGKTSRDGTETGNTARQGILSIAELHQSP